MRRIKSKVVTYLVEKVVGEGYTGVIKQNTVGTEGYIADVVVEDVTVGGASFSGQYVQLTSPSIHSQCRKTKRHPNHNYLTISYSQNSKCHWPATILGCRV